MATLYGWSLPPTPPVPDPSGAPEDGPPDPSALTAAAIARYAPFGALWNLAGAPGADARVLAVMRAVERAAAGIR